ncbi:MAG TPA: hypothetical protein VGK38_04570 [Prolixibacteraceae bacterium]
MNKNILVQSPGEQLENNQSAVIRFLNKVREAKVFITVVPYSNKSVVRQIRKLIFG